MISHTNFRSISTERSAASWRTCSRWSRSNIIWRVARSAATHAVAERSCSAWCRWLPVATLIVGIVTVSRPAESERPRPSAPQPSNTA